MKKLLYINDTLVDLLPNTLIALTFQAADIGDLRTRATDSSAKINLPKTSTNKQTLENIELINSLSSVPYRKASIKYFEDGLNIITNGVGIITESGDNYKLNIYGSILDFFSLIDGKNVDDMDFEIYETIDDAYIDSIRLSTGTFSAPVIDFGTLFPSKQTLNNTKFLDLNGWSNENLDEVADPVEWGLSIVGEPHLNTVFTDATGFTTTYLVQDYKFFLDFRYRITLEWEITMNDASGAVNLFALYIGTGTDRQLIASATSIFATTGVFTFDETFVVTTQDYDTVQIYAEALAADPGDQVRIVLKSIKITDVAGIIDIKAPYYIPLVSYSDIIYKIISDAGYNINLEMINQAYFEKLYISFSKSEYEYPDRLINKMKFRALASGNQSLVISDALHHNIEFPVIIESGSYGWYNQLDTYEVPELPYNVSYVVKARIIVEISFASAVSADFYFTTDGVTQTLAESVPSAADDIYVFTFESDTMTAGATPNEFKLTVVREGGSGTITVNVTEAEFWVEIDKTAFDIINLSALILPTIAQKDFIKDFFIRFGAMAREKDSVITVAEMQNIIQSKNETNRNLLLPPLDEWVQTSLGSEADFALGPSPSVTVPGVGFPGVNSEILYTPYGFIQGVRYRVNVTYTKVINVSISNPRAVRIIVMDDSNNFLSIESGTTPTPGELAINPGPRTFSHAFIAPAGATRIGIQFREGSNVTYTVNAASGFAEVIPAIDWTAKRDLSIDSPIKFDVKNYAQENIFRDITDNDVIVTGASHSLDIDNETLNASKVFFTSIMAAVEQNNNNGMRLCRINIFDRTQDSGRGDYIASPCLFYLRDERVGDSEIMYNGVVKTDYLICVYNDPNFEFNTTWEYFLTTYYPLISAALQKAKTVTRGYNLNALDIATLNLFRLIYDDNLYYMINKVAKYVPGQSTKVELFKVL